MTIDLGAPAGLDVVTPNDARSESWANGLGVTRVLAKTLAWRLSIAELRGRMPFSQLSGTDRILIPLSRETVTLTIEGVEHRVSRDKGIRFPGESRVIAAADRGGVSVVNLMVKRNLAEATCHIRAYRERVPVSASATLTMLLAGRATLDGLPLPPGSALLQASRPRSILCESAAIARFDIAAVTA